MFKIVSLYLIFAVCTLQSCTSPSERRFSGYRNNFYDSIKKYQAVEFDFMYDNLLPQKSYLVNGKVKFLVLKSSGELCDSEKMYIFDLKTDSLIQKVERSECYETADRLKKSSDIIFVRTKETTEQFYDNGMIMKTENADSDFTHNENITKIKTTTEKAFKKDQLR